MRCLDDILSLRVPNIYKLQLSLPVAIEHEDCLSFFDCKLRRMFIVAPIQEPKIAEVFEDEVFEDVAPQPAVEEERKVEIEEVVVKSKLTMEKVESEKPAASAFDDDLLFDVV